MRVNALETGIVAALLAAVSARAAIADSGFLIAAGHALALLAAFTLVRSGIARVSEQAARLFFAAAALLLVAEGIIQAVAGLHLNWFVVSLFLQANAGIQIGLSLPLLAAVAGALAWGLQALRRRADERQLTFNPRTLVGLGLAAAATSQLAYGIGYYDGAARVLEARRHLPFFWAPHPYRANKLLGYVLGPRGENPFSVSRIEAPQSADDSSNGLQAALKGTDLQTAPNILLIVADSLRAVEIRKDPALTPAMTAAGADGYLSLDHLSVSNCTHFSLYSLFTGKLASRFGAARRRGRPEGLAPGLAAAGYRVTTAESNSLDWYDLSDIILPAEAARWLAEGDDAVTRDRAVTEETVRQIGTWQAGSRPGLHVAYYTGTHFPYGDTVTALADSDVERYRAAINLFDREVGQLLAALRQSGLLERTLVIVTSDHGEELLADGRVGHASRLSAEQVEVPLLVLGGGADAAQIRSHLDVAPYLAAAVGDGSVPFAPPGARLLANCDYDFPSGFAVIDEAGRHDFLYDEGYLVPLSDNTAPATAQRKAARLLIDRIKADSR